MGPYRCLCVPMDCNGSSWVFIGPFSSLLIRMGPNVSL